MNIINPYRYGGAPRNGMIAEYLFHTNADDSSGNGYNGTLNGDAAVSGGVLTLDGTGDFVSIADADDFSFTDDAGTDEEFSISLWVKSTIAPAAQQLVSKFNNLVAVEWYLSLTGGGNAGKVALTIGDGGTDSVPIIYAIGSTAYTQNQWHHIVVTYDGSESENGITIYLDNADDSATPGETPTYTGTANTSQRVLLGARDFSGTPGSFFTGDMDNVRIYNRELTTAEVTALYNEGHS